MEDQGVEEVLCDFLLLAREQIGSSEQLVSSDKETVQILSIEPALSATSSLSACPHSEISLAEASKPLLHFVCRHFLHSNVSSA